jgi:3-hydroxybutyryl-CoA dehydrogenase
MRDVDAPDFTLGVLGAGAMGAGIAQVALSGGVTVVLSDANAPVLEKARDAIFARLDRLAEKGDLKRPALNAAKSRLRLIGGGGTADFVDCDAVVEAIVEDLDVKRRVFAELEAVVGPDAILASNTSSLPIAAIAQACRNRARVAGMHFFNPVPVMRLVEIIETADTAPGVGDA